MARPTPRPGTPAFGEPAVRCAVFARDVPCDGANAPLELHRATRERGRVLFASRERDVRSIVVTRAALRLTVRGGTARIVALDDAARPLLDLLRARLTAAEVVGDALCVGVPTDPADADAVDRDALQARSLFDPVRAVAALCADRDATGCLPPGLFGAFGADLVDRFEELGPRKPEPFDEPDLELVLGLDTVVFDAQSGAARVVTRGLPWEALADVRARHAAQVDLLLRATAPRAARAVTCGDAVSDREPREFLAGVAALREHIAAGDVFQAVLSRAVQWRCDADSLDVFEALAAREPTPYAFHLELERGALFGASPETCLRVTAGDVEIRPIAGTAPRSPDRDTDDRLALALLFDPKERAEHVMLLDLARNDVARVCAPGTTVVERQFAVEKYSRVQHLVSHVRGRLRPELDALHAYRAAANMGTLTGAPKARAVELVRALEPTGRGFYGGAVGYLLADGTFDSCIVIRSMRVVDDTYRAQAGAGIVWHSDPQREFEETEHKLGALRAVMAEVAR